MKIVALAGGVGGAKLAFGLAQVLASGELSVIVNTGDDFVHYGLYICPDLDTVCYHLAGINNISTGWGRKGDSFLSLSGAVNLGGPNWFQIGDKDLGTHLERTRRLHAGQKLSEITKHFCQVWNISTHVYPMTDDKISTQLQTKEFGELPFQEYFVHHQCQPTITSIRFSGVDKARPVKETIQSIGEADLIVICPSNPWVSIDPILSIRFIRESIIGKKVIAVSPIIQNKALKGPAAKMFSELGIEPSALAVLQHYKDVINGFIFDKLDVNLRGQIDREGIISYATDTIMTTDTKKVELAKKLIDFSLSY
jgi:LPPG:FO 2-phospho-L-lactate transferase